MLPEQPNILFLMRLHGWPSIGSHVAVSSSRRCLTCGVDGGEFFEHLCSIPAVINVWATMFTGRRTDQTRAWSNEQGVAVIPRTGALDKVCLQLFGEETCSYFREQQNVSATLVDTLRDRMEPSLYGKVDVGAGILQDN